MTPPGPEGPWDALTHELMRNTRAMHLLKQQIAASLAVTLDPPALGVLHVLLTRAPCRQGDVAGAMHLDPSTVSRHMAGLVRAGYVERVSDPDDGRATRLVPTGAGRDLYDDMLHQRTALVADILRGWPAQDVATLTRLLARLNDCTEHHCSGAGEPAGPGADATRSPQHG